MKYKCLILAIITAVYGEVCAQGLKGGVESYETVVNNVFILKSNNSNGVLNLTADTVIGCSANSLTAVLLDRNGKVIRSENYGHKISGMGGPSGAFFSISADTARSFSGRIDTETGSLVTGGNLLQTESMHFERDGFACGIPMEEPLDWIDYTYSDGRLVRETGLGNSIISQGFTVSYQYNDDGTVRQKVSENNITGLKECTEFRYRNGRIDCLEISYVNYLGKETAAPAPGRPNGLFVTFMTENDADTPPEADIIREKRNYSYNQDGSYQVRFMNEGTDKVEYYDRDDRLLKTVLPDGSVLDCSYNSSGDPILVSKVLKSGTETMKYDSYRYDNHGNWTRRRVFISDEDGFLIPKHMEYRRFCYRDGEKYESKAFRNVPLEPWHAHVITLPDNSNMGINISQFGMGTEMKEIDDSLLDILKKLPGFTIESNGSYTLQGHPLIIDRVIAGE